MNLLIGLAAFLSVGGLAFAEPLQIRRLDGSAISVVEADRMAAEVLRANGVTGAQMAVIDRAPRSATILADMEVECEMLSLERFEELQRSAPRICIQLLTNLGRSLSQKLRKANRELAVLE